jgi:hypothetical protein
VVGVYALLAFGTLVKGDPVVIVENGQIDRRIMRLNDISRHDLEEDMRLEAKTDDLSKIHVARLDISFIKAGWRRRNRRGVTIVWSAVLVVKRKTKCLNKL